MRYRIDVIAADQHEAATTAVDEYADRFQNEPHILAIRTNRYGQGTADNYYTVTFEHTDPRPWPPLTKEPA